MEVEGIPISGVWLRQIPAGGDVHYRADPPADYRWQRGEVVEALYFADSEDTSWAEWYRAAAEVGLPPKQLLPRDMWRWELSLPNVADLSTPDKLKAVGLSPPHPTQAEWPGFQAVGEALFAAGWPALMAPSAARPEGMVICVFREDSVVPGTSPIPPPTTFEDPPFVPKGLTT